MQQGFWKKLKTPILAMAPMANVTDAAFRQMFAECGAPDVYWTEFVSVEGLLSPGKDRLLPDLWHSKAERPIVAQIFGAKPDQFAAVGALIKDLGFDGIDINMGCPDRGVEKTGAGAALIKNPALAKEVIRALKKSAAGLPVSVKTRIGYAKNEITSWIPALLEEGLAALTVHLRTREEMSDVPAHWELAREIVALREKISPATLILGNGDVASAVEARLRAKETGVDGVMVGTGLFGNPWFFSGRTPDLGERLARLARHAEIFEKMYKSDISKKEGGGIKNFEIMKKHFKAYVTGFDGAKELRIELMGAENAAEVRRIIGKFLAALEYTG